MDEASNGRGVYKWTAFPMRETPGREIIFWIVVIFTVLMVYWNLESVLLTLAAALLLLGSLSSFYLPTTYILSSEGAVLKRWFYRRRFEWRRVRSTSDERDGLFMSPFPVKSRLENFRGIYLPYRGNREEILSIVRKYAPDAMNLPAIEEDDDIEDITGSPSDKEEQL